METLLKKTLPTSYTITLYDLYEYDNTVLDILDSNVAFKNKNLKDMFLSYWGIYEISAETIALFKLFLKQVYNSKANIYLKQLDLWDANFSDLIADVHNENKTKNNTTNDNGTSSSNIETINYDLPNTTVTGTYASDKTTNENTTTANNTKTIDESNDRILKINKNQVKRREEYSNAVTDIIQKFILEFSDCFLHIW